MAAFDPATSLIELNPWPDPKLHPLQSRMEAARAAAAADIEEEEEEEGEGRRRGREEEEEEVEDAGLAVLMNTDYDEQGVLRTAVSNLEMRLVQGPAGGAAGGSGVGDRQGEAAAAGAGAGEGARVEVVGVSAGVAGTPGARGLQGAPNFDDELGGGEAAAAGFV